MRKISDCDSCQFNARSAYMVCAVHPQGVKGLSCLDYRPDQKHQEQWQPSGWKFTDDGDMMPRFTYPVGERHVVDLENAQRILDTHPMFTEYCPNCGYHFSMDRNWVHFDCPECNWIDDSI
ncbi:DUF6464 family protein [Picosynechococcus sp. NKBG15041c]|uniref:DUF6464 family protein n=1 Tax=Picosynechococcus sp. NKBG15041c TaxID=1407650 RepID=UPI000463EAC1